MPKSYLLNVVMVPLTHAVVYKKYGLPQMYCLRKTNTE